MATYEQYSDNAALSVRKVLTNAFAELAVDMDDGGILKDSDIDILFNKSYMKLGLETRVKLHASVWLEDIMASAKQLIEAAIRDKLKNAMKAK